MASELGVQDRIFWSTGLFVPGFPPLPVDAFPAFPAFRDE
jgi:hypothetical protein